MQRKIDGDLGRLRRVLGDMQSVLVAFSGGADSALLLRVAGETLGDRAVALTAVSPTLPRAELAGCRSFAGEIGIRHLVIESKEMENPDFVRNREDRCYFCKSELFRLCRLHADALGLRWIAEGSQKDDLDDHRPGRRAAEEGKVRSPLIEAGIGKADVRAISHRLGLPTWDKPTTACLSSRFPTGTPITIDGLRRVEACESALRADGFRLFRVRVEGENARLELAPAEIERMLDQACRRRFVEACRREGFRKVSLDLEGYTIRDGGRP